jgi:hypothetical protein
MRLIEEAAQRALKGGDEMKKQQTLVVSVVGVFMLFSFLSFAYGYSENVITVKASVHGTFWNSKGEATDVSLITVEGDKLFVVHYVVGDELLKLVEQNVRVTGAVSIDRQGGKKISIYKYEVAFN